MNVKVDGIKDIFTSKDKKEKLKNKYKNISICLSLASGYVWKEKVNCSNLIAQELLDYFNNNEEKDTYSELIDNYYKISIGDNFLYFRKSNTFGDNEHLDKESFLNQKLVFSENHKIPLFLLDVEKEKMQENLSTDEQRILNKAYNRQELNGNKYYLENVDKLEIQKVLEKTGYYEITIGDYLLNMSKDNKELKIDNQLIKNAYNNYILEIGCYVAKKIKEKVD